MIIVNAAKLDQNREQNRKKMRQPETKRRRLILKQERATQKGAYEASEGSTYQSGTISTYLPHLETNHKTSKSFNII